MCPQIRPWGRSTFKVAQNTHLRVPIRLHINCTRYGLDIEGLSEGRKFEALLTKNPGYSEPLLATFQTRSAFPRYCFYGENGICAPRGLIHERISLKLSQNTRARTWVRVHITPGGYGRDIDGLYEGRKFQRPTRQALRETKPLLASNRHFCRFARVRKLRYAKMFETRIYRVSVVAEGSNKDWCHRHDVTRPLQPLLNETLHFEIWPFFGSQASALRQGRFGYFLAYFKPVFSRRTTNTVRRAINAYRESRDYFSAEIKGCTNSSKIELCFFLFLFGVDSAASDA